VDDGKEREREAKMNKDQTRGKKIKIVVGLTMVIS